MIAVLQRILEASVVADGEPYSQCGKGLLILLGVSAEDDEKDATLLADKISKMRIFEDSEEKMNLSVNDMLKENDRRAFYETPPLHHLQDPQHRPHERQAHHAPHAAKSLYTPYRKVFAFFLFNAPGIGNQIFYHLEVH